MERRAGTAGADDHAPYQRVVPRIPTLFEGAAAQAQFDSAMGTLQLRRQLVNLTFETRKSRAEIAILEAEVAMHQHRLDADPKLTSVQRQMLTGKRDLARAQAEHHQEMIEQRRLEIQVLAAAVRIERAED